MGSGKSQSSSPRSSPRKSGRESASKAEQGSSKKTADAKSPVKGGKDSKSVEKVKKETTADSPSGRKKRTAKALEDSDEDFDVDPMPPPSKKKTKNVRHEVTVTPAARKPAPTTPEPKTPVITPDEKKKQHAAGYFKFLSRPPPKNLGAKEIPEGAPDCLANLTFVITGVLPSFERDDMADAIKKYGGRVTGSVSKKTSYVIVGDEPGASKIKKVDRTTHDLMSRTRIV